MEVVTGDGVWIQLDTASIQSYCHDQSGDAWCMVSSSDGEVFLSSSSSSANSDHHLNSSPTAAAAAAAAVNHLSPFSSHQQTKGFDFTNAATTPTFSPFTSTTRPRMFHSALMAVLSVCLSVCLSFCLLTVADCSPVGRSLYVLFSYY